MTPGEEVYEKLMPCGQTKLQGVVVPITRSRHSFFCVENEDVLIFLKEGYRNPTGFRRWVKVAGSGGLCYTRVMGTWKSKTDTNICYSIIFGKDIRIIYENISGKNILFGRTDILSAV